MRKDLQQSSHNNLTINMVVHLSRFFMFLFKIFWSKNFSVGVRLNRSISSLTTMNKFWLNFFSILISVIFSASCYSRVVHKFQGALCFRSVWFKTKSLNTSYAYFKERWLHEGWAYLFILSLVCKAQTVPLQVLSMKNVRITFHHNRIKK